MQAIAEAKAEAAEVVAKATAEADLRVKQAEAKAAEAEAKAAEAVAKAKLETAKRLLVMGLSPDAIKEATNLTDSQLAMLTEIPRRLYAPHSPIFTRFCMAISA